VAHAFSAGDQLAGAGRQPLRSHSTPLGDIGAGGSQRQHEQHAQGD
jgi:hypothetical protein